MTEEPRSRVFYRESPKEVVVVRDGKEIARYRSPEELVEVHMKGMVALDQQAAEKLRKE